MKDSYQAAYILILVIGVLGAADVGIYAMSANYTNSTAFNATVSNVPVVNSTTLVSSTLASTIPTTTVVVNTTSTVSTTTLNSTTIPATIIAQNQTANSTNNTVPTVKRFAMVRAGLAKGTIRVRNNSAALNITSGSVLSKVNVRFKSGSAPARFNITIENQSQSIGYSAPKSSVYQYIQINQSLYNSTQSIDPEISNVTYNFTVDSNWISQQGIDPSSITLLKYLSGSWVDLPTVMTGQNATAYSYFAVSNSFSTYAVSYISANALATGNVVASIPAGFTTYFFAGASNTVPSATAPSVRWTITSCTIITTSQNVIYASVGFNTITGSASFNSLGSNDVIAGIGANVIETAAKIFSTNTVATRKVSANVVFSTTTANSFVVVVSSISNSLLGSFTSNAPGNVVVQSQSGSAEWASVMVINSLAIGSYSVNTIATTASGLIATSVFVFPSYTVTYDIFPSTGFILTNGINQKTTNTVASLLGVSAINAIAPSAPSNFIFYSWLTSNNLATILANPTSQNTLLTVEGTGTVSADFNAITQFFYGGLPAGSTWNVVYNSLINSSSTSNNFISFITAANTLSSPYSVNSQILTTSGNFFSYQYKPVTASGALQAGNAVVVTFNPSFYAVTLNDMPASGSISSNGLTWNNNGLMKVSGTGTINAIVPPAPSNFIFYSWTSNNVNAAFTSATSQNTLVTILGNTIVWAQFNGITQFFQSGLPNPATWNVVYNSIVNSSSTSNSFISFVTKANTLSSPYSVNSQIATSTGNFFSYQYKAATASGSLQAGNAIVVSFAPAFYSVTLNDLPQTETIVSNGVTWNNNGLMKVSGSGTINAVDPTPANFLFSSWTANNVNAVFASSTSQNTVVTILGNTIITANFNAITNFTETGLPADTPWSATYNSVSLSNSVPPNDDTVTFNTTWWGGSTYSIANVVVGPSTYIPTPSSGSLVAGNTILVTFTASSCAISLSNSLINFGSVSPGSEAPTANAVIDTNSGTSQSAVWIYGGDWIGTTYSFLVTNTLWNGSPGIGLGNALTTTATNTLMVAPGGGSNTIYLGASVPIGQPSDTYTQNVVIENVC